MSKTSTEPSIAYKLAMVVQLLIAIGLTAQIPNVTAPVLIAGLTLAGVLLTPRQVSSRPRR